MDQGLIDQNGQEVSRVVLSEAIFCRDYNESLVHQVVVSYLSNARIGSRAQKNRAVVSHSTRKPWKQKGTGRARAGMSSSPLWRGGGRTFPSSPEENFSHKVNRKMYKAAMCCIYSQILREGRLFFVDKLFLDSPKTKNFVQLLSNMGFLSGVLIVTTGYDENLDLSSRNIRNCLVIDSMFVDPVTLVNSKKVLMTEAGLKVLEGYLS